MAIFIPLVTKFDGKGIKGAESSMHKFGGVVAQVAAAAVAAIGTVAIGSAKMAAEFETSFAKIQGLVGVSKEELGALEEAARTLGPQFGKSAQEAAEGLFFITSAGLRGAEAVEVLEAALKGSAIGLGDMESLANAATAAMNTYSPAVLSGTQAVDSLAEAVRLGQFAPEELAGSLGRVIPIAAELGVSFQETTGVIAALTRGGLSASEAVTGVRGAMQAFLKPTAEAATMMEKYGLSTEEVRKSIEEDGFLQTLINLRGAFGDNEEDFTRVIGSIEGLNAVLGLTGANVATNTDIIAQMTDGVGVLDEALAITQDTAANKFAVAMESMKASLLPVGDLMLDVASNMLDAMGPVIDELGPVLQEVFEDLQPVMDEFGQLLPELIRSLFPLIPIFGDIFKVVMEVINTALPPLIELFNIIMPLVQEMIGVFAEFLVDILDMLAPVLMDIVEAMKPMIEAAFPIFMKLVESLVPIILELVEMFLPLIDYILPVLEAVIMGVVLPALSVLAEMLAVALPMAMEIFKTSGLGALLIAMGGFSDTFSDMVFAVRVFWAESFNRMIEGLETFVNTAIRGLNWFIEKANSLPGVQIDFQATEVSFDRISIPGKFDDMTFAPVDVSGISDIGRRGLAGGAAAEFSSLYDQAIANVLASHGGVTGQSMAAQILADRFGIPMMGDGGIVSRPTLAIIGESGPEAVVPLGRGMGANINITVNAGMGANGAQIGQEIVSAIKRYERSSGKVFASA